MSWPAASFAIVLGVLLAGWLVYERSRPSARMAAVVGTLAAVAALGRDAFVALPDVKPITAMTLVVGYSLGPLPGFTVGAVGMLASNMLLGQGPYTPWQMVAWGLVGLLGAALGRLTKHRVGRFGLALACALSALMAKEIMNLYTWTIGASHTPAALLATAIAALPFDVTDTVASFLFGLAFGPELARLLGRMRARMTVSWEAATTPLAVLALICAGAGAAATAVGVVRSASASASTLSTSTSARAATASTLSTSRSARAATASTAIARAIAFLQSAQNSDGGFGGALGQHSSELYSAWVAIGLSAAGRDPLALDRDGHTVLDSIDDEASTLEGAGDLERTILALRACGVSTRKLPGGDPVRRLLRFRSSDGSFGQLVNLTSFAVLALRAAGESPRATVPREAVRWLAGQQNPDGGFSYAQRGAASDVDDTAAALEGVVAASAPSGPVVSRAVAFLEHVQNSDGGYPLQPGGESDAQSTAWAIQGLLAAGQDPSRVTRDGRSPLHYLEGLVASNGSVRYSSSSSQTPVWVTAEALAALAGKPLPIAPVGASSSLVVSSADASSPPVSSADAPSPPVTPNPAQAVSSSPVRSSAHRHLSSSAAAAHSNLTAGASSAQMNAQMKLDALAREAGVLVGVLLAPVLR